MLRFVSLASYVSLYNSHQVLASLPNVWQEQNVGATLKSALCAPQHIPTHNVEVDTCVEKLLESSQRISQQVLMEATEVTKTVAKKQKDT